MTVLLHQHAALIACKKPHRQVIRHGARRKKNSRLLAQHFREAVLQLFNGTAFQISVGNAVLLRKQFLQQPDILHWLKRQAVAGKRNHLAGGRRALSEREAGQSTGKK